MPATVDLRFTPLPTRWKLCSFDRSRTTIEYVPALARGAGRRRQRSAARSCSSGRRSQQLRRRRRGRRLRRRRHRRRVADRELLEHLRRVRVALDRVAALAERDSPGDGRGRLDRRELLDTGAEEAELCSSERSRTVISYVPGSSWVTRRPLASASVIVKPGPTVPLRWTACAGAVSRARRRVRAPRRQREREDPRSAHRLCLRSPGGIGFPAHQS